MAANYAGFDPALVDRIYEAAVVPDRWPAVLESLAAIANGQAGALVALRHGELVGHKSSPLYQPGYDAYFAYGQDIVNPRPQLHFERQYPAFLADVELQSREELAADQLYARFLRPSGLEWCAGTVVQSPSGDVLVVDIARSRGHEPFGRQDLERVDPYRPHLARAALLASQFALRAARDLTDAMQLLGLPAVAMSSKGQVVAANELAQRLDSRFRFRAFDRVALSPEPANALLQDALNNTGTVRSIPMPSDREQPATIVHLLPISGSASDIFAAAKVLLIVTDVTRAAPTSDLLAGLFDLTPAEARLARGLASGSTLEQIARGYSISVHTVRNQLASLFQKTGTQRQSQLVLLFSGASGVVNG